MTGKEAYARLFTANALALLGIGVSTVALALLAYDLAGAQAGAVLGTALATKMGANILVVPLRRVISTLDEDSKLDGE